MFMTKKKRLQLEKEAAERAAAEAKAAQEAAENKEFESKIKIKKSMTDLRNQAAKLSKYKETCLDQLVEATKSGDDSLKAVKKTMLKMAISKEKMVQHMMAQFEFSMQLKEFNQLIGGFTESMVILSDEMSAITKTPDMMNAQRAFEKALENNQNQTEAINAFVETASNSIANFSVDENSISDDEIDQLIQAKMGAGVTLNSKDNDIENRLKNLDKELSN